MRRIDRCSNCGREDEMRGTRCSRCYMYYHANGRDSRPEDRIERARQPVMANCPDCGRRAKMTMGRCHRCARHYRLTGETWAPKPPKEPKPKQVILVPATDRPCVNCEAVPTKGLGRCESCYRHYQRYGFDQDPERVKRLKRNKDRALCSNCDTHPVKAKGRCQRCFLYLLRTGRDLDPEKAKAPRMVVQQEAPAVIRRDPTVCVNCGDPTVKAERCNRCAQFLRKKGRDSRPEERRERGPKDNPKPKAPCAHCGHPKVFCRERCWTCWYYRKQHGCERPLTPTKG